MPIPFMRSVSLASGSHAAARQVDRFNNQLDEDLDLEPCELEGPSGCSVPSTLIIVVKGI